MTDQTLSVRNLGVSDLASVASIHVQAFPDSALTKLGFEAVRRYYEWQMKGPHDAYNIGAFDNDGTLGGFCFGGIFRGALGGFLDANRRYLISRVITRPWLLANPLFFDRVRLAVQSLNWRSRRVVAKPRPAAQQPQVQRRSFGILSIAVRPNLRGTGVAQLLMSHSEQMAKQLGYSMMNLSVHEANSRAIGFYEKLGWTRVMDDDGVWQGRMTKTLATADADSVYKQLDHS